MAAKMAAAKVTDRMLLPAGANWDDLDRKQVERGVGLAAHQA